MLQAGKKKKKLLSVINAAKKSFKHIIEGTYPKKVQYFQVLKNIFSKSHDFKEKKN